MGALQRGRSDRSVPPTYNVIVYDSPPLDNHGLRMENIHALRQMGDRGGGKV